MTLYSLHGFDHPPTLEQAANRLEVPVAALDRDYGVVLLDPKRGSYAVAVKDPAAGPSAGTRPGVEGPWANPRIEPFGGPASGAER